jgi:protein involved in polysaccharide export with SLBB domain
MTKKRDDFQSVIRWGAKLLLGVFVCAIASSGQVSTHPEQSRAIDKPYSRAEQEAEQLVSLSPDKVIALLQDEPGLLLKVKKLLVRKAFEQGRLLDPKDLNDEALFRLIRQDEHIRALVTHEIEDRAYIRAKPTRLEQEEIARRQQVMRANTPAPSEPPTDQAEAGRVRQNQEDAYWSKHEQYPTQQTQPGNRSPYFNEPAANPQLPSRPENMPNVDSRRQVERTGLQSPNDVFDGVQGDGVSAPNLGLPRVGPDELPSLLNTSATDRSLMGNGRGMDRAGTDLQTPMPGQGSPFGGLSGSGVSGSGVFGSGISGSGTSNGVSDLAGQGNFSQQASLDVRSRPRIPYYPPSSQRNDHPIIRHRPDPYADVPSLYDMYSQYSKRPPVLERFGTDVFRNGTGNFDELPMDMPVGPDYVLGPGDSLSIDLWGGISQRLQRVVDRQGRVALPEVGTIEVNGRSLGDVQHVFQTALRSQFRDVQADVSLARLKTVRVYVVGDVERPGAYDVSSLSTPLNAVYMAGGPTQRGSLRILHHHRGKQLVQDIDVYDLLLHGIRSGVERLQAGDTVLVPPLGPEVTIEGMVRRPAIYELGGEKSLSEVLELSGGVLPTGTLRQVDVERLQAHDHRTMLRLDLPESNNQESVNKALDDFQVQDGDRVKISPIVPYTDKTVYLDGHVFRPGKFAYKEGMKISDVIHSYHELLPEPYKRHAEIVRLSAPDYQPMVLAFNLEDALAGKEQDLPLKPFDTIRVFGRYDFEDPPVITVTGEVRDPGDHVTNGVTYLRDVIYLAGGTTPDAELDDAQIFRRADKGKLKVLSVNLSKALAGDSTANILLEPKDRVFIHKDLAKTDPPTVTIEGEVERPGKYPLGAEMTAAGLVRLAGGLKRSAYTQEADLTRFLVEQGSKVSGEHKSVPLARALADEPDTDTRLLDGDVLTIRQLTGWNDMGATIAVKGEVAHPGTYGIEAGERLSSILARVGGFQADAYPYGAIFERVQVRDIEEQNRAALIRQVQDEAAPLKLLNSADGDERAAKEAALLQWKTTLERLQNTPPLGRLVIHISPDLKHWANTPADIQVRAGDVIYIPKKPTFVMVDGSVYNSTAVTYKPGKSAGWYLRQAGGPNNMANKRAIFVIRADGSVVGGSRGIFTGGVLDAALRPGDMILVPEKAYSGTTRWKNTLQAAQFTTAVGIAVQVAKSF